ncbi:MAG TPA: hypothetical protein VMH88_00880 [Gemmatimonadales bacterium]|nr:hypothetical protein [Gemmatimonadales bacterium]
MTLPRLFLAWLPVAVWFLLVGWLAPRLRITTITPTRAWVFATLGESVVITLVASLWFDSLGHGGWWLLFALIGLLAAGLPGRPGLVSVLVTVVRYVGAGGMLAWRLR